MGNSNTSRVVFSVLLIEDNIAQANLIKKRVSLLSTPSFLVRHAANLKAGIGFLSSKPDVILLDLSLPDSQGLSTFIRMKEHAPDTPIIILTALDNETFGLEAVRHGAQDYLVKGKTEFGEIPRVLRYAIERNKNQSELRQWSLKDELTGLHNRRSFYLLAEQEMKSARREKRNLLFTFLDINGLKVINDGFGHNAGDRTIRAMAELLNETFRSSDIVARLSGDEFAVLSHDATVEAAQIMAERLETAIKNFRMRFPFDFSFSWGTSLFRFELPSRLEDLMAEADHHMYERKKTSERKSAIASAPDVNVRTKKIILIIEDDAAIRKMLHTRFSSSNFEVTAAADGEEGLALARQTHPDLILLDLRLPKLPGEEVCKAVREDEDKQFSKVPIIMLTAKTSDVDRVIGHVIGATQYVTKPFDGLELLKLVKKLLRPQRGGPKRG